ncbi:penicillin-binding protein 2 [Elusimicrobiota bacterium]
MSDLSGKLFALRVVIVLCVSVFVLRLFFLQVVFSDHYRTLAERNRFQVFYQQAPRGLILDRRGGTLAGNVGVFNLYYNPQLPFDDKEAKLKSVERIVGKRSSELRKNMLKALKLVRTTEVLSQIDSRMAFRFMEANLDLPQFFLSPESIRNYPLRKVFSHTLGYLTKLQSWNEFRRLKAAGYRFDSWIGRFGMEKSFEDLLAGVDGAVLLEVDVRGRPVSMLKKDVGEYSLPGMGSASFIARKPVSGKDIVLTIDSRLLKVAHKALIDSGHAKGSVVALDPLNGEVLAIVSVPGFDPNDYVDSVRSSGGVSDEFNRALTGTYPPGSIFKIITSIAAFESRDLDVEKEFTCLGKVKVANRNFRCWRRSGHGKMDYLAGIKNSCDVYFYRLGLMLGGDELYKWADIFPYGKALEIEGFSDLARKGNIPSPAKRQKKNRKWYPGDTLNVSIGQGELLATPIQLATMISMVATRGIGFRPHIIKEVIDPGNGKLLYKAPAEGEVMITANEVSARTWEYVEQGLELVVSEGTGRPARLSGYKIYGKTGTSENPLGDDHALFVCYLKDEDGVPRLAVSVVVEHGGHGSSTAAPIARKIMKEFISIEHIQAT